MLHYVALEVKDLEKSKSFYEKLLSVLDYSIIKEEQGWFGYGNKTPSFWLGTRDRTVTPMHIAFAAKNKKIVVDFYEQAVNLGATIDSQPKLRDKFYLNHYCSFIRDFDHHRIGIIFQQ